MPRWSCSCAGVYLLYSFCFYGVDRGQHNQHGSLTFSGWVLKHGPLVLSEMICLWFGTFVVFSLLIFHGWVLCCFMFLVGSKTVYMVLTKLAWQNSFLLLFFLKKNLRNEGIDNKIKNDKILIFVVSF